MTDRAAIDAFAGEIESAFTIESAAAFLAILEAAESARPELRIDRVAFAKFLGAKLRTASEPVAELAERHVPDLILVFAVGANIAGAVAAMDRVLRAVASRVSVGMRSSLSVDELLQELRVHFLLEREGRGSRIGEYAGRSSLARWLHVAATRHALNLVRRRPRELPFEEAFFLAQADLRTPDARLLDATYGGPFREAVGRALARLGSREQALLWFSLVDGAPSEQIAKVDGVHRTTAMRWIDRALRDLRHAVEEELAGAEELRRSELSSIVRSILSRASN